MSEMRSLFGQSVLNGFTVIILFFLINFLFSPAAIAVNDETSNNWLNKSIDFYIKRNYDLALMAIDKSIELNPNNAILMNNKGIILNKLGRYDEALEFFNKAIIINPFDSKSWYNRGINQEMLSQPSEAVGSYTTATLLDPGNENAWNRGGIVLRNLGRYSEAIHSYDKVIELHPGSAPAWINKGIALSYSGRFAEAQDCFYKVIEMKTENQEDLAKAWMYVGLAYLLEKKPKNAIYSFEHAIEKGNEYDWIWATWFCKGIAFKSMGCDEDSRYALDVSKRIRIKGNLWDSLTYGIRDSLTKIGNYYALLILSINVISYRSGRRML